MKRTGNVVGRSEIVSGLLFYWEKEAKSCNLHDIVLFLRCKNNYIMHKLQSITPIEWAIIGLTIVSVGLITTGLLLPPPGVVDGSVIASVGELFAFGALLTLFYAIKHDKFAKVTHGDTTISVGHEEEQH